MYLKRYFIILLIFLAGVSSNSIGQLPGFKTYNIQDGLVGNSVKIIYQDSKGFIWIGTWEGLSRYDGYRFSNYSKANGLVSNLVNDIYETPDGKMVVALNNGSTQVMVNGRVEPKEIIHGLTINRILAAGKAGLLIFTDEKGVQRCNLPELQPTSYAIQSPHSLFVPVLDSLLLVAQVGGFSLQLYNNRLEELKSVPTKGVTCQLLIDSQQRIWAATTTGLKQVIIDPKDYRIELVRPPPVFQTPYVLEEPVYCMLEDVRGDFWIGTRTGVVLIEKDGTIHKFTTADGLPGEHIICLFQDREKNIWIGTAQGVARMANHRRIKYWSTRNGLLNDYVASIKPFKNDFLLGGGSGIQLLRTKSGKLISLKPPYPRVDNLLGNSSTVFAYAKGGHVGSFNLEHNLIRDSCQYQMPLDNEYAFAVSDRGTLILGTASGELVILRDKKLRVEKTPIRFITQLLIDKDQLWIGSYQEGLYTARIEENGKLFASKYALFSVLPDSLIRAIFKDSRGNLWIGTRHNGVYKISQQKDQTYLVDQFDQRRGLLSDWVKSITEDSNHNIWVGSVLGVDKLIDEKNGWRIFNFSRFNNLFGVINDIKICDDKSILVGMNNGLAKAPDMNYDTIGPLPVYFTRIRARIGKDSSFIPQETATLNLPYTSNSISFDFSSPGFINEKEMKYSYRLIGSTDSTWIVPVSQQSVSYASLQPGRYRFEVRNLGWNGEWGATTSYAFTVRPPFWKTWWFILSIILVIAVTLYTFYNYRIRQLKRLQQVRNRIATDLHDEIGSTLTNVSILTELSKRSRSEPDKSEIYLDRIREEIDASGQALDDIIWSVNSRNDTFHETAARMRRYAAELFDAGNVRYELTMDPQIAQKKIVMEQRRDLFLVYKEILNNIHKHAAASSVFISLFVEKENIKLIVGDDGKGFDTSKDTHRNGLANIKERVSRWKGGLAVESGNGKGTVVQIQLPLSGITQKRD